MALSAPQIVDSSRLIGENSVTTQQALPMATAALSAGAVAAIGQSLSALVGEYLDLENKHIRIQGGKEGLDLDFDRNRLSLMKRARVLLGMSPVSDSVLAGNSNVVRQVILQGASYF